MKSERGDVRIEVEGHVAVVSFARPPHNHASSALLGDLADALEEGDADPAIRASVLRSDGKPFCAGADFANPGEGVGGDAIGGFYANAIRLFAVRKPIVAAIQGAAVGAGLGLALVADFRVAAPEARFAANFVKLGFHPGFGLTYTVPRLVGEQKAALLMLTGRRIGGDEAVAWGLADQLAPLGGLREAAVTLAAELAENAPLALEATRATLRRGLADAVRERLVLEARLQDELRATEDFQEGIRAVAERRPGRFVGR